MVKYTRIALLIIADIICINAAYIISFLLRFEFKFESDIFWGYFAVYANNIFLLTLIKLAIFWTFGLYRSLWRYAGTEELIRIVMTALTATAATIVYLEFSQQMFPRSIYIYSFILDIVFIGGVRFGYRILRELRNPGTLGRMLINILKGGRGQDYSKIMVVGAGDAGASIIKDIKQHPEYKKHVVIAVDDNPNKLNQTIAGVKIAGTHTAIKQLARKYGVDEIIIAIPSANKKAIQEIINECNKTRCKMKILPGISDLINERVSISKLRDVDIEDLLGREPVQVNLRGISSYLEGKIVLVTGGGGSIGSELCRQIARFKPRKLIALDIYENTIFELSNEIKNTYPGLEFEVVITSVRSRQRLKEVFLKYKPHVVFHAAAHKHVPLMEQNPKDAVINNIVGTKNMIDLSDEYAVENFVLISTDKAVNPTNVMGATKRIAEMLLQEKSAHSRTSYSAVRFGNVLGSNGSVIPLFRKQIERGGPVTVTHEDITRYFMTIPEAVQLVIQAGALATGGEIFILDMGEPVRIIDLAENVIRLSGYTPYVDIDIKITGLRPGEKLYEELLLDEEGIEKTAHNKIYVGHPIPPSPELSEMLEKEGTYTEEMIRNGIMGMKDEEVKDWLQKLLPNYNRDNSHNGSPNS
ncbi:MAG: nucleoside-diphosphate sugar epimerase/dehydratase [Eubacteriales bacterium]|nr:nucleoside-diphosphate sugar epimerase/dehydratase [Eubacteriales bacterium]MDD4630026.1 nucleoside-diphosphate sugar epimerase/dehydratase [Eubacteriales bacterium]